MSSLNSVYYFAYGSNMNEARMRARGVEFVSVEAGVLPDYRLRFNKQSHSRPEVAYANIEPAPGHRVEGVLYQLQTGIGIDAMDFYEGTPVRYSRECLHVQCTEGREQRAWVYLANPAFINNSLLPESNYLEHLLAGRSYLSAAYIQWLREHDCRPSAECGGELGLKFNV